MPALTVQNAEIKTATVEVKTLTISGKQVTLAVFRQLKEHPLIALDGTINGVPWGTVNYHPDKCAPGRRHIHVVWQAGSDLRRARVDPPGFEPFTDDEADTPGSFAQAAYCQSGHQNAGWARHVRVGDVQCWEFNYERMVCQTWEVPRWRTGDHTCATEADMEMAKRRLTEAIAGECVRRTRYQATWDALSDLPQLFIAV